MIDKFIQDQLNSYADNQHPPKSIVNNAIARLDEDKLTRAKGRTKGEASYKKYILAPLVLIMLAVVLTGGVLIYNNIFDSTAPPAAPQEIVVSYSDLYAKDIDLSTVTEYKQLTIDGYSSRGKGFYRKGSDRLVFLSVKYKSLTDLGISEVMVISEEVGYYCRDLDKYRKAGQYTDRYINGEYATNYNKVVDGRKYFASVEASYMAGESVISNIFG